MLRIIFRSLLFPFRALFFPVIKLRGLHRSLHLDLEIRGDFTEAPLAHGIWTYFKPAKDRFYLLVLELQRALDSVRAGQIKLKQIRLIIERNNLGWAQAWELRDLLQQFGVAGVGTYAYLLTDDKISLFMATACRKIATPESCTFDLSPFTTESFYLQGLLSRLGIRPQFLSVGEFKSAAELFTRKGMSPAARRQAEELIADLQANFLAAVQHKAPSLNKPQKLTLLAADDALKSGLIDAIITPTEFSKFSDEGVPKRKVDLSQLDTLIRRKKFKLLNFRKPRRIALIVAEGNIIESAESRPGTINWPDYAEISGALESGRFDGILIRINSPGGSAMVSQLLWREWMQASRRLESTVKSAEKKPKETKPHPAIPIIATQGNVAASGGYYLSVTANQVFATPMTITGSIGVVGGKFNVAPLLKRVGVDIDRAPKKNPSPYFSPFADFNKSQEKQIRESMHDIYGQFLRDVALGRGQSVADIKPKASGRVYSGNRARALGLTDAEGGLAAAFTALKDTLQIRANDRVQVAILPSVKEPLFGRSALPLGLSRLIALADFAKTGIYTLDVRFLQF
jgi:protease IV